MKASEFPFHIQQEVVFRDIDVMGHVNNAVFVTYLETARTKYLMHFMDVDETLTALPLILGKIECTFHAPAHFGEILTVATGISRFGNKSFDMAHQIDGQDGRLVLSGKTIMIMYDYDQGQSILIPDTFKQQVNQRQGNWRYAAPD